LFPTTFAPLTTPSDNAPGSSTAKITMTFNMVFVRDLLIGKLRAGPS
jgi:hypothetical protein